VVESSLNNSKRREIMVVFGMVSKRILELEQRYQLGKSYRASSSV